MASGIGTLSEGPLHAALKDLLARPGDVAEARLDRFRIDLLRADGELVEIQTGPFGPLGRKLDALLDGHRVRVVVPIPAVRRIIRVDDEGEVVSVRRSPRPGTVIDLFDRLVAWPTLIAHPNLTLELILCEEDHIRGAAPERSRSGRRRRDPGQRVLRAVIDRVEISGPDDLLALISRDALSGHFTTKQLAERLSVRRVLATRVVYCLRELELIIRDGSERKAPRYRLAG